MSDQKYLRERVVKTVLQKLTPVDQRICVILFHKGELATLRHFYGTIVTKTPTNAADYQRLLAECRQIQLHQAA